MGIIIKDGRAYTTKETPIDIKAIENNITRLESAIANIPPQKTRPDNETLDFWNNSIPKSDRLIKQKERFEIELAEINRLLDK